MDEAIRQQLLKTEKTYGVKILYACEAGSRAIGLANETSDFDIRFLYIQPIKKYLSIKPKSDVISVPISDKYELHGWDLHKALFLLKKSNPTLLEWLHSPIIYLENVEVIQKMKAVIPTIFSKKACFYHYLNMAKRNFQEAQKTRQRHVKLYLNIMRPLLSCLWLETYKSFPNVHFNELVTVANPSIKMEIEKLAGLKQGKEATVNFTLITSYIEKELNRLVSVANQIQAYKNNDDSQTLDEIFLFALKTAWKYHF